MNTSSRPIKNVDYVGTDLPLDGDKFFNLIRLMNNIEFSSYVLKIGQSLEGIQYVVDKGVSDDLQATDVRKSVSFCDVPWPARFMEFYFEDPEIPTLIVSHSSLDDLRGMGFPMTNGNDPLLPDDECLFRMHYAFRVGPKAAREPGAAPVEIAYYHAMGLEEMDYYCRNEIDVREFPGEKSRNGKPITGEESDKNRAWSALVAKVLIYASIPQFKPTTIAGRKQFPSYGGKPGVGLRPIRPAFRIQYLPRVLTRSKHHNTPTTKQFKGRRGHMHHYGVTEAGKKKFKNRAGTYDWYPPVKGPNGEIPKPIFRIRKPKLSEVTA